MCFTACQTIQFLKFTGYLLYTPPTPKYQTNKQTNKKNPPKMFMARSLKVTDR